LCIAEHFTLNYIEMISCVWLSTYSKNRATVFLYELGKWRNLYPIWSHLHLLSSWHFRLS